MFNYCMTITYNGKDFFGWQRHGEKPTIQFAIEQALLESLDTKISIRGSGRTDRGAHAHGQTASFELSEEIIPIELKDTLNNILPREVRIKNIERVSEDFHARDSAIGKHYRYIIWNDKNIPENKKGRVWHTKTHLDAAPMISACPVFEGKHDFASFATKPNFKQKSTIRTIYKATMYQDDKQIIFDIWADGFLYKMVRNIVRAIVKVGEKRYDRKKLLHILEAKDRKAAPGTAPASGLYLEHVYYSKKELESVLQEGK